MDGVGCHLPVVNSERFRKPVRTTMYILLKEDKQSPRRIVRPLGRGHVGQNNDTHTHGRISICPSLAIPETLLFLDFISIYFRRRQAFPYITNLKKMKRKTWSIFVRDIYRFLFSACYAYDPSFAIRLYQDFVHQCCCYVCIHHLNEHIWCGRFSFVFCKMFI